MPSITQMLSLFELMPNQSTCFLAARESLDGTPPMEYIETATRPWIVSWSAPDMPLQFPHAGGPGQETVHVDDPLDVPLGVVRHRGRSRA